MRNVEWIGNNLETTMQCWFGSNYLHISGALHWVRVRGLGKPQHKNIAVHLGIAPVASAIPCRLSTYHT